MIFMTDNDRTRIRTKAMITYLLCEHTASCDCRHEPEPIEISLMPTGRTLTIEMQVIDRTPYWRRFEKRHRK